MHAQVRIVSLRNICINIGFRSGNKHDVHRGRYNAVYNGIVKTIGVVHVRQYQIHIINIINYTT